MVIASSPFGGQARTRVLLALRLLDESYPRELARVLELPVSGVQMAVRGLERDGLVAGRTTGRMRLVRLNPRYFAREELQRYLLALAGADAALQNRVAEMRRRPRASGKPA
jgi:DNA-binding MarR family transcriptional regulator